MPIFRKLYTATKYSSQGLAYAIENELAFRLEIFCAAIAIPVALYLGSSPVEKSLMIGAVILVMILEIVNSAIEAVVDRIGKEFHNLSMHAKDLGSAAVFVGCINVLVVWGIILYPRVKNILFS